MCMLFLVVLDSGDCPIDWWYQFYLNSHNNLQQYLISINISHTNHQISTLMSQNNFMQAQRHYPFNNCSGMLHQQIDLSFLKSFILADRLPVVMESVRVSLRLAYSSMIFPYLSITISHISGDTNKRLMSIVGCFIGTFFPQGLLHLFLKLNPQYFDYFLIVLHLSSQGIHARLRQLQLIPQIPNLFLIFFHFHLPFLILAHQLEYLLLLIHRFSSLKSIFCDFVLIYQKSLKFFSFLLNLPFQAFVFLFVFLCLSFRFGNLCFEDEDFILILLKFFLGVTQCFFQVYGHFLILFLVSSNILELQQSLIFEIHQLFIFESSSSIFRAKLPVKIFPLPNLFSQLQILLLQSLNFSEESIDSSLPSHRYKQ